MATLMNFIAGLVFGLGLVLSGMIDPAKVTNFFDITGQWDPSLAFVLAGAVGVTALGYAIVLRRNAPIFAERFELPDRTEADSRLVVGALLFGIGWGLYGFSPGSAITSLTTDGVPVLVFLAAMFGGAAAASKLWRSQH